ncbi:MAG: hypothetical protein M1817_000653 [Caeruleum heppii]|nr:MAG: hypothetical protein M1817_000653 [Caeruleum heppii]
MPPYRQNLKRGRRFADTGSGEVKKRPEKLSEEKVGDEGEGGGDAEVGMWELSPTRRLTLSTFNNQTLISIREYYEKKKGSGEWLPGRKGISLPLEQYRRFLEVVPEVERVLRGRGEWEEDDEDEKREDVKEEEKEGEEEEEKEEEEEGDNANGGRDSKEEEDGSSKDKHDDGQKSS